MGSRNPVQTSTPPDADAAWRADVLETLRAIQALLELRRPAEPNEAATRLLAAIYDAVKDRVFVSKELVAHAELPQAEGLRDALVAADALNAKRLGKLLKRIEGRTLGGHFVTRAAEERAGAIWQVRVCGNETRTPTSDLTAARKS